MLVEIIRDLLASRRKPSIAVASSPQRVEESNPLADYFYNNPGSGACKWHHYFELYHRHLAKYRGQAPVVVEIGVAFGGSLPMWHNYFGAGTRVVGIDVDPACGQFANATTDILIGDQADRSFLTSVRQLVPRIDILIDDGGHTMIQQIATFEELYPHVHEHGTYVCEDVHTSLLANFGGGYLRKGTFLDYAEGLVDRLFGWHSEEESKLKVDAFTLTTLGMHFYNGMVFLEKRPMSPPRQFMTYGAVVPGSGPDAPSFRP
jgi:cephalosporin hydroxylase